MKIAEYSRHAARVSAALALLVLAAPVAGQAQYRQEEAPTLAPPPPAPLPPALDPESVAAPFRSTYRSAGSPLVMLFWNVLFDDQTGAEQNTIVSTRSNHTDSFSVAGEQAGGGKPGLSGNGSSSDLTERVVARPGPGTSSVENDLDPRSAAELEAAFRSGLEANGTRLVSRAASMRLDQVGKDMVGNNAKQLEAEAVAKNAELLLEVAMVPDATAPLGAGFRITLTEVRSRVELASLYTKALPPLPPAQPARLEMAGNGFEKRQPPPPRRSTAVPDVGAELSRQVMQMMTQSLGGGR